MLEFCFFSDTSEELEDFGDFSVVHYFVREERLDLVRRLRSSQFMGDIYRVRVHLKTHLFAVFPLLAQTLRFLQLVKLTKKGMRHGDTGIIAVKTRPAHTKIRGHPVRQVGDLARLTNMATTM